jgi:hypothetical protein
MTLVEEHVDRLAVPDRRGGRAGVRDEGADAAAETSASLSHGRSLSVR